MHAGNSVGSGLGCLIDNSVGSESEGHAFIVGGNPEIQYSFEID